MGSAWLGRTIRCSAKGEWVGDSAKPGFGFGLRGGEYQQFNFNNAQNRWNFRYESEKDPDSIGSWTSIRMTQKQVLQQVFESPSGRSEKIPILFIFLVYSENIFLNTFSTFFEFIHHKL